MISADLFRQLTAKQAESFADAGTFKFKNIAQPVQAYQWRLKDYSAGRRTEEVPAIAVEAFSVAPNDEDLKSAAEDLRDQILYSQSRRTGLKIRDGSVEEIKDATYALRGRLRVARGRARANLSLILKADGSTSWAEVYEGEAEDLYGFCDEIAAKVNSDLRLYINSLDNIRIAEIPDDMLSVSELRTRAAGLFYECSIPAIERCVSVLARACRLSPDDGMALSMWAIAVSMLKYFDFESPDKETLAKLSAAYDRGVELLPRSDFVFFARAQFRATHLRNGEKTMADAKRCHAINPDYPQAHLVLGYGYLMTGGFENAVREIGIACQQTSDPYWPYRAFHKAVAQFCGEDYAGAVSTLDDLIDLKPSIRGFRKLLIIALKAMNDETRAKQEEMAAEALPDEPTFSVQEPPLPDSHLWLRNELAPTLLG